MNDFIRGMLGEMKDGGEMQFGQPQFDKHAPRGEEHSSQNIGMQQIVDVLQKEELLLAGEAFLGLQQNGLPVYWDVCDPINSGSLLVAGNTIERAETLMETIAQYIPTAYPNHVIEISGILTPEPAKWQHHAAIAGCDVIPTYDTSAEDFVLHVTNLTMQPSKSVKILVFENLEKIWGMNFDGIQNIRWLLQHGPANQIYTVASVAADSLAGKYNMFQQWKDFFPMIATGGVSERISKTFGFDVRGTTLPYGAFVMPGTDPFMSLISPHI